VSHLRTSYQLYRAEQDLAKLRRENGFLDISNPAKIHVVTVPVLDQGVVRWRVYVPLGPSYALRMQVNDIPVAGYPATAAADSLRPGDWLIELRTVKQPDGSWTITSYCRGEFRLGYGSSGTVLDQNQQSLSGTDAEWLADSWVSMTQQAGTQDTESFDVGDNITLLRLRADKKEVGTVDPAIAPGVMLWLTP
jgi:hypothetical protein